MGGAPTLYVTARALQEEPYAKHSSRVGTTPPLDFLFPSIRYFLLFQAELAQGSPCLHFADCNPFFFPNKSFLCV